MDRQKCSGIRISYLASRQTPVYQMRLGPLADSPALRERNLHSQGAQICTMKFSGNRPENRAGTRYLAAISHQPQTILPMPVKWLGAVHAGAGYRYLIALVAFKNK